MWDHINMRDKFHLHYKVLFSNKKIAIYQPVFILQNNHIITTLAFKLLHLVLWLFVDGKKVERKCAHKSKRWSVITEVGNPVYLFDRHCMLLTRLSPVAWIIFYVQFGQNIAVLKLRYNLSAYVLIILMTNW